MVMLKLREWTGKIFALAVLIIAILLLMGVRVPVISELLGL